MNHKELTVALSHAIGVDREEIDRRLQIAAELFVQRLIAGDVIAIQGFGVLEVRKKNERLSVHPQTKIRTLIPPKLAVAFRQSATLKEKLKDVEL